MPINRRNPPISCFSNRNCYVTNQPKTILNCLNSPRKDKKRIRRRLAVYGGFAAVSSQARLFHQGLKETTTPLLIANRDRYILILRGSWKGWQFFRFNVRIYYLQFPPIASLNHLLN